ncbi:MAG: hypothetical protein ABEJ05_07710 [Haloglomus sp.]
MADPSQHRSRRRGALLVLVSLCLLAQPAVGNGPGPDPQTVYTGDPVDLSDEATEGDLALDAEVNGDFAVASAVRRAVNGTYERPAEEVGPSLRTLTDDAFYWDGSNSQYYAVDATLSNDTFRLTAERVTARAVAEALAVPAAEMPPPVARAARPPDYRAVVERDRSAPIDPNPTLVATDGGYVYVTRAIEPARDPYRLVKLGLSALAGAGIVAGVLLPVAARLRGG